MSSNFIDWLIMVSGKQTYSNLFTEKDQNP